MKKIFIMAGEASGDLQGALLVNALKKISGFSFSGVGGRRLGKEGIELLYDYSEFASMGFIEPLLKISFYKRALKKIADYIFQKGIDTVILIDFPGFNLLLAEKISRLNRQRKENSGKKIKIIYYISPQIWAWHYSRIKKIKKYIDMMIVLYPFEEELYRKEGVPVSNQ